MHAAPTICLQPCPEGTRIHQKPTASSEGAQLWDKHHFTLSWFRKAGPTIILNTIRDASVPLRGTIFRWRCSTYPQLRCFAACSGFHYIGPAPRNPQLRLDLGLTVRGCVATARRHSLLKVNQSLFSYKTATFVTSFICYVVSLRSIHTLISFDTHIHIVRYTHSYRTM